jgi:hypothetical protein
VVDVLGRLHPLVGELDGHSLDGKTASKLVDAFVEVENLAAAGRVLATRAYDRSGLWRLQGYRSAASWMAGRAGTPVGPAIATMEAAGLLLRILVTRGVEVVAVAHGGRTVPASLRAALEYRDPKCIVPHCPVRRGLQIDHRVPWAEGGPTTLANLARLCRWHHYQKSHLGYTYRGGPGAWEWIPPEVATDPPSDPP